MSRKETIRTAAKVALGWTWFGLALRVIGDSPEIGLAMMAAIGCVVHLCLNRRPPGGKAR